jgi:hypothetical protein
MPAGTSVTSVNHMPRSSLAGNAPSTTRLPLTARSPTSPICSASSERKILGETLEEEKAQTGS